MKNILIILLLTQSIIGCTSKESNKDGFVVTGKFSQINEPVIVKLQYADDSGNTIVKRLISKEGEFKFEGKTFASDASLLFAPYHPDYDMTTIEYWEFATKEMKNKTFFTKSRSFFLEDGYFNFKGDNNWETAKLETDSKCQELFRVYNVGLNELRDRYGELEDELDSINTDDNRKSLLEIELEKQHKKITDYKYAFASKYPHDKVSLVALKGVTLDMDQLRLESAINKLSDELKATTVCEIFREKMELDKRGEVGRKAIDFTLEDALGQQRSLSSFKGKYVLVDFWASWCGPCRAENPKVLKAYNRFKDENFDIISISIDRKKDAWLKAVEEDKLPWLNLIDKRTSKDCVAKAYGVLGVPSSYLIDPSGMIVAKNLRGEALEKKLEEVFK